MGRFPLCGTSSVTRQSIRAESWYFSHVAVMVQQMTLSVLASVVIFQELSNQGILCTVHLLFFFKT
jgi:hypothetical protein